MPENSPAPSSASSIAVLAVNVGNTNTAFEVFMPTGVEGARARVSIPNANAPEVIDGLIEASGALDGIEASAIVFASTNKPVLDALVEQLRARTDHEVYVLGVDLAIPIRFDLAPEQMTGQDRFLNALAAYQSMQQACIVVDAGTAMTVDFVDGEGVFQGGAIMPGFGMAVRTLHEKTSALPEAGMSPLPDDQPFGKNTDQAIRLGVASMLRGGVRALAERYAIAYEAYPPIVVTGGDAKLLFGDDELIDRIVPNLTLLGIRIACERALGVAEDDDE
ncbi:MAG: type III pantothenate kinase [Phycisphaerales bacterium]|nr:type III pantothenate kinase [Phycisphaerales bacterium]